MNEALTTLDDSAMIAVLESSLYPGASHDSIRMVLGYCKAAGLDPMLKPVHIVPMWDKARNAMRDVVMPGIGLYRVTAARSNHAGTSDPEFGPDATENIGGVTVTYPIWCRVTVYKLVDGEPRAFSARELWKENYATKGKETCPNAMWTKRPYGQLAKCAEAQALRKAFPEVGSQPTAEEMEGGDIGEKPAKAREVKPAADFEMPAALAAPAQEVDYFEGDATAFAKARQAVMQAITRAKVEKTDLVPVLIANGIAPEGTTKLTRSQLEYAANNIDLILSEMAKVEQERNSRPL